MFSEQVLRLEPELIACRRALHADPELSFEEYRTTDYLIRELQSIQGVEVKRPAKTGAVAVLRGKKIRSAVESGKRPEILAFRADIDALPIQEETGLSFSSRNPGVMHACGHDGHTAMQLTAIRILAERSDEWGGEVRFLFQHAEEKPPGGAVELFQAGVMDGVDELYGMHLSSSFPTGSFGVRPGALTSATDRFEVWIKGSEGHSAYPEQCTDPVVTAAEVILALQTIVSRKIAAAEPAVVSVCQVAGGSVYNVIPQEVRILGATRTFSRETREKLPHMMEQIISGVCHANGADYTFDFQKGYASVMNDAILTEQSRERIARVFGKDAVLSIGPLMPGEDFSALTENCPGFFVELGARSEEKGCVVPHHNRKYLMDEDALKYGTEYIVQTVLDRLG